MSSLPFAFSSSLLLGASLRARTNLFQRLRARSDNNFKTLNSLLNRQVLEYEALHHLSAGSTSLEPEPWEPEEGERRQHVLGEKMEDKMAGALKWDEEEEVEMRRERGRMAAEGRRRREREARGRETGGS